MNLVYRAGTIHDVEKLQQLALLAYGQYRHVFTEENREKFYSNLAKADTFLNLLHIATCFVCVHDSEVVGMAYIVGKGNPTTFFEPEWSYIRMVGVNPTYSGRGIAKRLTQMCIDHARQTGEQFIALHTAEFMEAAQHIYAGLGFKPLKELDLFGKHYRLYLLHLLPSYMINYNNKIFRPVSNTDNGETSGETVFVYKQDGNILTSEYKGGRIVKGHLIGLVDNTGVITMRYHQVNDKGELMTGTCTSTPELLPTGKIRLHETWEWTSGDRSKGQSVIEEQ